MNCRDFESIILGLDRGESPGAAAQEHAASCAGCRKELDTIQDLRASLGALARHDAAMEAPARLEAALLRELAQGREKVSPGAVTTRRAAMPKFSFVLAAAAAVILVAIAAGIGLVRLNYLRTNPRAPVIAGGGETQTASPERRPERKPELKDDQAANPSIVHEHNRADQEQGARGGQIVRDRERERNRSSREIRRVARSANRADDFEIATDYFPIDFGSSMQPIDGGQIVRIKLPRSALRNYGLPVDPLRADEAVKADVVIGNDGMARAIRFVH
jgi:hypothetical protein